MPKMLFVKLFFLWAIWQIISPLEKAYRKADRETADPDRPERPRIRRVSLR